MNGNGKTDLPFTVHCSRPFTVHYKLSFPFKGKVGMGMGDCGLAIVQATSDLTVPQEMEGL